MLKSAKMFVAVTFLSGCYGSGDCSNDNLDGFQVDGLMSEAIVGFERGLDLSEAGRSVYLIEFREPHLRMLSSASSHFDNELVALTARHNTSIAAIDRLIIDKKRASLGIPDSSDSLISGELEGLVAKKSALHKAFAEDSESLRQSKKVRIGQLNEQFMHRVNSFMASSSSK